MAIAPPFQLLQRSCSQLKRELVRLLAVAGFRSAFECESPSGHEAGLAAGGIKKLRRFRTGWPHLWHRTLGSPPCPRRAKVPHHPVNHGVVVGAPSHQINEVALLSAAAALTVE